MTIIDRMSGYSSTNMLEVYKEQWRHLQKKKAALQREFDELAECDELIMHQLSKELWRAKHK